MNEEVSGRQVDAEHYVVVTIAPNGVVHCYGGDNTPFTTKTQANAAARRMRRDDKIQHPNADPVFIGVRKILYQPRY